MKRILIFFLVIGITAISSVSMAAMSNSRIRKEIGRASCRERV